MRYLRDKYTGEVYGYNYDMSKLKNLEVFDDEDKDDVWKGPPEPEDESNKPALLPANIIIGDDPEDVSKRTANFLRSRAEDTPKPFDVNTATYEELIALTEEQINAMSEEEIDTIGERLEQEAPDEKSKPTTEVKKRATKK